MFNTFDKAVPDILAVSVCCLKNYYQAEVSRVAMYVRYIYKLYDMHIAAGNHTEAALTLQLHAELLDWSDQPLPASLKDSRLSPTLKWQGKEAIYLKIIEEFDYGKVRGAIILFQIL